MNALSLTLKRRDLVAMGLHVGNMFVKREASPIEVTETAHVMSLGKGITRPPGRTSDVGAVSENHGQKWHHYTDLSVNWGKHSYKHVH